MMYGMKKTTTIPPIALSETFNHLCQPIFAETYPYISLRAMDNYEVKSDDFPV